MDKVVDITELSEFKIKQLENIINRDLIHPDPEVLVLWKQMASETIRKFSGAPKPTKPNLSLSLPSATSDEECVEVQKQVTSYLSAYKQDVLEQMLDILKETISLQKEVAEYRVSKT
jgi:LPS O-antigen subunit length determinant protein (WzzB/FepE family)